MTDQKKKEYKYILLDWDGTICNSLREWLKALDATLRDFGIETTEEEIKTKIFNNIEGPELLGINDLTRLWDLAWKKVRENLPQTALFPKARETLQTLKRRGKSLAVVTNLDRTWILASLKSKHLEGLFEAVVADDDVKKEKPNPEPVRKALEMIGGAKEESIIIGDSGKDIQAGRNAGIDSLLFFPNENKKFYDEGSLLGLKPTYVVREFKDILEFV